MATTLPTFTIIDPAKEERVLRAFDRDPNLTAVQEYRVWLAQAIQDEVLRRESEIVREQAAADIALKRADIGSLLA